jgi:hypothetical protein
VISARAYVETKFLGDFTFRSNISTDMTSLLNIGYDNQIVGDGAPAGRTNRGNVRTNSMTFNQLLSYSKVFQEKHFVEALLGHENYDLQINRQYLGKQDQILSGNIEPDNFVTTTSATGRIDVDRIESFFSRVNYVYNDNFFSIGGAWSIDQEDFFSSNLMQLLKLRASYGQVGNHDVSGYYPSQALYDLGYNNASEPGILQASLAARDLVWESNNTFDIGVDFAFANRFQGTLEYYNRVSENLLFEVPLSLTTGLGSRFQNIGTMGNQGIEFSISGDVIRSGDFKWNAGLNISTFDNEFKKLPFKEQIEGTKKYEVGSSIYDFWLRDWVGVDPETGDGLFRAEDFAEGDDDIRIVGSDTLTINQGNARFHYAGSAIPDFFGGLTNTFTYKAFTLSVLVSYSVGGDIYDGIYGGLMDAATEGGALHKDILNRWQQPGDITDVPKMDVTGAANTNVASDRWLTSASYLNLRSVNLSYTVPREFLNRIKVKNAMIYLAGENLGWASSRKGMYVSGTFGGTTSNTYTPARSFTLGINLTL